MITLPDGRTVSFTVDPFRKHCLLYGLDDIGLTLEKIQQIKAYEARRRQEVPWLFQPDKTESATGQPDFSDCWRTICHNPGTGEPKAGTVFTPCFVNEAKSHSYIASTTKPMDGPCHQSEKAAGPVSLLFYREITVVATVLLN